MCRERIDPPNYWQMLAWEYHAKADACEHPETRATLRKAAESYEQLASRAELTAWAEKRQQRR